MNVWRTSPVILAVQSIPTGKPDIRQPGQQRLNLRSTQAAHADIDGSCISSACNRSIGVVNVAAIGRMINALSDPVIDGQFSKRGESFRMQAVRFSRVQLARYLGTPGKCLRIGNGRAKKGEDNT